MTTPREAADACCDHCRSLPGKGPWCGRCGAEMPDAEPWSDTPFAGLCGSCDELLDREPV